MAASDTEVVREMEVRDGKPFRLFGCFDEGVARAAAGLED
jgi:hypothetical protein